MVDAWSAGHYGNEPAEDRGKRLVRALSWVRSDPRDNGYARPIEGLVTVIDLNRKEVVRVEDYGVVPLPPRAGQLGTPRRRRTAARISSRSRSRSRAGRASRVTGQKVRWQKMGVSRRIQSSRGAGALHGRLRRPTDHVPRRRSPR